jgi:hypothetical protein
VAPAVQLSALQLNHVRPVLACSQRCLSSMRTIHLRWTVCQTTSMQASAVASVLAAELLILACMILSQVRCWNVAGLSGPLTRRFAGILELCGCAASVRGQCGRTRSHCFCTANCRWVLGANAAGRAGRVRGCGPCLLQPPLLQARQ